MNWTLEDFARACAEAGVDWKDVSANPPPIVMPEKNCTDMTTPLVLELTVYSRNSEGKRYYDSVQDQAARETRRIPFYTSRPLLVPEQTQTLCLFDMGKGVFCHRPLTQHFDPVEWRCGWGHRWWPMSTGRIAGTPLYEAKDVLFKFPPQRVPGVTMEEALQSATESFKRLGEAMNG